MDIFTNEPKMIDFSLCCIIFGCLVVQVPSGFPLQTFQSHFIDRICIFFSYFTIDFSHSVSLIHFENHPSLFAWISSNINSASNLPQRNNKQDSLCVSQQKRLRFQISPISSRLSFDFLFFCPWSPFSH